MEAIWFWLGFNRTDPSSSAQCFSLSPNACRIEWVCGENIWSSIFKSRLNRKDLLNDEEERYGIAYYRWKSMHLYYVIEKWTWGRASERDRERGGEQPDYINRWSLCWGALNRHQRCWSGRKLGARSCRPVKPSGNTGADPELFTLQSFHLGSKCLKIWLGNITKCAKNFAQGYRTKNRAVSYVYLKVSVSDAAI